MLDIERRWGKDIIEEEARKIAYMAIPRKYGSQSLLIKDINTHF